MFASCIGFSQHEQDGRRQGQSRWGNEPLIGDGFRDMGVALIIGVAFHMKATGYMPQTSGGTNEETYRDQAAPASLRGRLEETVSQPAIRLWTNRHAAFPRC